jgi:hypothetical protein
MKFSERYTEKWKNKIPKARKQCAFRCCLCLKRKLYLEIHHATYKDAKNKKIAGRERLGVHIFPLCKKCHKIAHLPENYIKCSDNPALNNHNTDEFKKKLVHGYQLIQKYKEVV